MSTSILNPADVNTNIYFKELPQPEKATRIAVVLAIWDTISSPVSKNNFHVWDP